MEPTRTVLATALLAGLAVWAWLPPARRLVVMGASARPAPRLPRWARARDDAPTASVRAAAGVVVATAVIAAVPGTAGLAGGLVAGLVAHLLLGRLGSGPARRERAAVVAALPETLDLLAACLEAGAPLRVATDRVATLGPAATRPALERVRALVGVGTSDADAWRAIADDEAWSRPALDLARSSETGSPAAALLRDLADEARAERRDALLKKARAVGVHGTVPLMTCFLPAFLLTGVVPIVAGLLGSLLHR